jgi:hypothetical protein
MFLELIATIFAGFACAGIAMLLNTATGKRLPRWITPVAAGLGMLAATISNEYAWFGRTVDTLPDGVEIGATVEERSWSRPWTLIWPYTKRFVAIDTATVRTNEGLPDQRLVDIYVFARWAPINQAAVLYDCAGSRSALLVEGATFAEDGSLADADWRQVPAEDPILTKVCET